MPICSAFGCPSRPERDRQKGITFHRFPKDEQFRRKWIEAVGRCDFVPSKIAVLCSKHFKEEDFDRTSLCIVRVREGRVPSIFDVLPPSLKTTSSDQRKPPTTRDDVSTPSSSNQCLSAEATCSTATPQSSSATPSCLDTQSPKAIPSCLDTQSPKATPSCLDTQSPPKPTPSCLDIQSPKVTPSCLDTKSVTASPSCIDTQSPPSATPSCLDIQSPKVTPSCLDTQSPTAASSCLDTQCPPPAAPPCSDQSLSATQLSSTLSPSATQPCLDTQSPLATPPCSNWSPLAAPPCPNQSPSATPPCSTQSPSAEVSACPTPRVFSPEEVTLKRKLVVAEEKLVAFRKKIKILQQSKRRLLKKNAKLRNIISEQRKHELVTSSDGIKPFYVYPDVFEN